NTFNVTVVDGGVNVCSVTDVVTLTCPSNLTLTMSNTEETCTNTSDGTGTATIIGGLTTYTYVWSDGAAQTTAVATGLAPGNYTVTVIDGGNAMCSVTGAITIDPANPYTITTTSTNETCFGFNDGTASITVTSGGTSPYDFTWSSGGTTNGVPSDTEVGLSVTVLVTVDDAILACEQTYTITLVPATAITLTATVDNNVTCNGDTDGQASAVASGGTTPYIFTWSNGDTGTPITGLGAGNITITAQDGNGCTVTDAVTITGPTAITANISATNATCGFVPCDGTSTVFNEAGGAGAPYTYAWDATTGSQTSQTANTLCGGTYTVSVFDGGLVCFTTLTTAISDLGGDTVDVISSTGVTCPGANDGTATVDTSCVNDPCTFVWVNKATLVQVPLSSGQLTMTGLSAGTYYISLTNNVPCTDIDSVTIAPANIIFPNTTVTDVLCFGLSTGSISFAPTGATTPYTYTWSHDVTETASGVTGLPANVYTVTITESSVNACDTIVSVTLTQPVAALTYTATVNNSTCGQSNGSINVVTSGGTIGTGYSYIWNSGEITEDLNNKFAGSYSQTITDVNNCSITHTEIINDDGAPTVTVNPVTECYNTCSAALSATITSAAAIISTTWNDPFNQSTATATGLCPGVYTLTVTDINGCSSVTSTTVTPSDTIFANETVTNISCNGLTDGSITTAATTSGASTTFTYVWGPEGETTTSITGLIAGTYTLTVSNITCSDNFSYTITEPTALTITGTVTDPLCNSSSDGIINTTTNGGVTPYTYLWSANTGSATTDGVSGLPGGVYTLTLTDNGGVGCQNISSYTLTPPTQVSVTLVIDNNVNCFGTSDGQATATGAGGTTNYTYLWDDPAPAQSTAVATGLAAGVVIVTLTDAQGCAITATTTITEPATAITATATATDATCNGGTNGSVTVTAGGGTTGYTYLWNDPAPAQSTAVATGLNANTWTATVTDANGCTVTASATISEPTPMLVTITTVAANCSLTNGTATATVSGGPSTNYTYLWSVGVQTTNPATGLAVGFIDITVTETTNGCTLVDQGFVPAIDGPTVTLNSVVGTSCDGGADGSIDVDVTGGTTPYTYVWNPAPGCGGQTTQDINCLSAGVYNVVVEDNASCQALQSFTVSDATPIVVTFTDVDATCGQCDGQKTADVTGGTGPYDFLWSTGGTTLGLVSSTETGLCAGVVEVSITDQNGCAIQLTDGVNNIGGPTGITITSTAASCFNIGDAQATATVTGGTTPYSYQWLTIGQVTATATGLSVGVYTIEISDANDCKIVESVTVTGPPEIVDAVTMFPTTCGASDGSISVDVSGGVPAYTFTWNVAGAISSASTTSVSGLPQGIYNLTVADFTGCNTTFNYIMNNSTAPNITITSTPANCFGDSIGSLVATVADGTPAYTFQWKDVSLTDISGQTTTTLSGIPAGTYVLEVTDAAVPDNCVSSQIGIIGEPDSIQFSTPILTEQLCSYSTDGTANLVPIGGTFPYSIVWGNGAAPQTGATATGLVEGSYAITLTDANLCIALDTILMTAPDTIFVDTLAPGTTTCINGSTGTIDLIVTGGTGASTYTFAWSDGGAVTEDRTGLSPGLYIVTVTDANLCSAIDSIFIGGMQLSGVITDVSCFGGNDGSIDLTVIGAATPYAYQWAPPPGGSGSNVEDPLGLDAMGYIVTVTDTLGCTNTATFQVDESPSISVTFTETSSNCGSDDGELTANTSGGASGYTYIWTEGSTTQTITGLFAGLYEVSITDANSCSQTFSTGLSDIGGPTAASISITNPSCFGVLDASACVSVTGGVTPYNYQWNPGGTTPNGSCTGGLTTGSLSVEVTDANGCKIVVDTVIASPTQITDSISVQSTTCGASDGAISVYPADGAGAPYTFAWNTGVAISTTTSSTVTGLPQGAIIVTVTDVDGCSEEFFYNVNGSTAPSISITSNDVNCYSGSDGDATSFVTGGTTAYTYQWTDASLTPIVGQTTTSISGLVEGCYFFSVTDAAIPTCVATQSFCITQPDSIQFGVSASVNPSCFNTSDGSGATIPVGGTLPYTFTWDGAAAGQPTSSITGLPGGIYHVTLTDNNGCTALDSVTLIAPPTIIIDTVAANTILCSGSAGGQIDIVVTGGSSSYTFLWSNGATTEDISGLSSGSYCVTVTDGNGCSENACWAVGGPTIDAAIVTDPLCYNSCDGSIDITVSGAATPFNYLWNPGGQVTEDATGLCSGTYSISITDTNSCSVFLDTLTIGAPDTLETTFTTVLATCGLTPCNGEITAIPTGGTSPYFYQWSDPSETNATLLEACGGVHPVSITDNNGCSEVFLAGLSDVGAPDSVDVSSTNLTCNGDNSGTATLDFIYGGTPPYAISWFDVTGTNLTITGLPSGTEFIQITDSNNCVLVDNVLITEPSAITDSTIIIPTSCGSSNGALTIYPSGGNGSPYSFTWSANTGTPTSTNTSSSVDSLVPMVVNVTVFDGTCSNEFSYNINPSNFNPTIDSTNDVSCYGESDGYASVVIAGGTSLDTYNWSNGSTTSAASSLFAGVVSVTITDGAGCETFSSATINEPDIMIQSSLTIGDVQCNGNCDGFGSIDFVGGTLPYTFVWANGTTGQTSTGLCAGAQDISITDNQGCIVATSISISEPTALVLDTTSIASSLCSQVNSGSINVLATGGVSGYTYLWDDGQLTANATGLFAGNHCLTVTDLNACAVTICANINDSISISIDSIADFSICTSDDSLILVGQGSASPSSVPVSYTWIDVVADTLSNDTLAVVVGDFISGVDTYTFITYATSNAGCFATQVVSVTVNDIPDVDAGEDVNMSINGTNELGGDPTSSIATLFNWEAGLFLDDSTIANPNYTPEIDGEFTLLVTVTDDNGCSAVDSVNVVVNPAIDVPNIFSPNGDGINDAWIIPFLEQYPDADLWIYNRWGELIYEALGGYTTPWDGTYNGKPLPVGGYYYVLELNHPDAPEAMTGPLAIIR
ncbi:MAG: gliding motility-associated C-terminal domain-containing protein, partial [Flavobacteriales bacterium]|nr:gliding motility-associated C-terminal domain-containing protein [Flavobacteriales bacterium]